MTGPVVALAVDGADRPGLTSPQGPFCGRSSAAERDLAKVGVESSILSVRSKAGPAAARGSPARATVTAIMESQNRSSRLGPPRLDPRFSWVLLDPADARDSALPRAMRKPRAARGRRIYLALAAFILALGASAAMLDWQPGAAPFDRAAMGRLVP